MNQRIRPAFTLPDVLALSALAILLLGLAAPAAYRADQQAQRSQCADHLRKIGLAIQSYAAAHDKVLPNNQLTSPHGSWNMLLLPHLGEERIAKQYSRANDWWDAAHSDNRQAVQNRLNIFLCPAAPHGDRWVLTNDPDVDRGTFKAAPTDYVGVAGAYLDNNLRANLRPGAMHNNSTIRTSDIADGVSNTFIVVEMADKPNQWRAGKLIRDNSQSSQMTTFGGGQWAAPNWNHLRSHDPDGVHAFGSCAVNCNNQAAIYGFHPGGAHALFVDGAVHFLANGLEREIMVALTSFNGGEVLAKGDY